MKFKLPLLAALAAVLFLSSCRKDDNVPELSGNSSASASKKTTLAVTQTFSEGFESGSKTGYAAASVSLASGSWTLDNALIGTSASDAKNGNKSARITGTGTVSMNFDVTSGASTVTVKYATYGSDGPSDFQLWASSDNGSTYTQVGNTVTASGTTLNTATFTVNQAGTLRFQLRKTTGGSNRINIDDFTVNSYDSGSTGGTGGSTGGSTGDNTNLLMGNPSGAVNSTAYTSNYLIDQTYYIESYNRDRGEPNWVSWYLGSTSLGSIDRLNNFRADTGLPSGWYEVQGTDYSGSGFDRGHNCPSADRTSTTEANSATFLMDNMVPQAPYNNEKTWANMENYLRTLVTAGNEVYIVMGSYGTGGTGTNGLANTVASGNVNVPSNIWKVAVVIPNGNNDLSRVTASTRVIAVNTPNNNSINSDWTQYKCTVRSIESATGYNLLSALPQSVQDAVETKIDNQ
ncbi:DNA/RNA non-specific endonuclease [Mucilaginibacter sp. KACC 22063]|uniref:DNA/RNA non-specific endonuclease n=1 Tax=Mucilaginibacter sp. KACC 22063 TaxID=3025666 RepID=UPI002365B12E|nr:DNA/RNA non-specific endonuclease [Mucilaginibacter sp. KACC 22063]WDF57415.1 DNA/RNA non-specific endonuclease [Mucilaginibacter sp. KACC 22063]